MRVYAPGPPVAFPVARTTFAPWLKPRSNKSQLRHDWEFWVNGERFVIEKGYVFDWSTIPRLAWVFYPPNFSEARQGALAHDYFYSHLWPLYERKFADQVLREFMLRDGARKTTAALFYGAVRIGRGGGWYAHKKRNAHPFWKEQKAAMLAGVV